MKVHSVVLVSALVSALLIPAVGCQKAEKTAEKTPAGQMPADHPPMDAPFAKGMQDAQGPTDGAEVALIVSGNNSAEEMNRALAKLDDPEAKKDYEMAFRYTFSAKQSQRNYPEAQRLVEKILETHPDYAPAYRVLGYDRFNMDMRNPQASMDAYLKAVELDPNYGEAHYALAFMYAMGDRSKGMEHYKKAMELGIVDERHLGERFYAGN